MRMPACRRVLVLVLWVERDVSWYHLFLGHADGHLRHVLSRHDSQNSHNISYHHTMLTPHHRRRSTYIHKA